MLYVNGPSPNSDKKRRYWNVTCQCGVTKVFRDYNVKTSKSCGCLKSPDLTGRTFEMLTVIGRSHVRLGQMRSVAWECRCECGAVKAIRTDHLTGKHKVKSCGCLHTLPLTHKRADGSVSRTHGMSSTRIHYVWMAMNERCYDKNNAQYKSYGGRGIYVCDRWRREFVAFIEDMGERTTPKHTIERIDNYGSYTCGKHDLCDDCREKNAPFNCKWATRKEQARNTRRNLVVTFNGESKAFSEWCEFYWMDYAKAYHRYVRCAWSMERVVETFRGSASEHGYYRRTARTAHASPQIAGER